MNGWQRSFQPSMKLGMAPMSCLMLSKDPRRITWRVMRPKMAPTSSSRDPLVGVTCSVIRGLLASQRLMSLRLWS